MRQKTAGELSSTTWKVRGRAFVVVTRGRYVYVYIEACTRLAQVSTPFFFPSFLVAIILVSSFFLPSFLPFSSPLLSFICLFIFFFFSQDNKTPVGGSLRVFERAITAFNQARYNVVSSPCWEFSFFPFFSRSNYFLFSQLSRAYHHNLNVTSDRKCARKILQNPQIIHSDCGVCSVDTGTFLAGDESIREWIHRSTALVYTRWAKAFGLNRRMEGEG